MGEWKDIETAPKDGTIVLAGAAFGAMPPPWLFYQSWDGDKWIHAYDERRYEPQPTHYYAATNTEGNE